MTSRDRIVLQRNELMQTLLTLYPGGMTGMALYRVLLSNFPDYTRNHCVRDLYYFEEKQYVVRKFPMTGRVAQVHEIEWHEAKWYLTAKGNEIAARLITDPALEL